MKTTRSEKSLSLLCHKFLSFYPTYADPNEKIIIHLDNMAEILEVERRRIYDIVNVLESVEILSRFCKNQYIWHGYAQVPYTLSKLKTLSVKSDFLNYTKVLMASQLETSVLSFTQEMNLSELTSVGFEVSANNMFQDTKPDIDNTGFELHKSFSLSSSSSSSSSIASVSSLTQIKKNKTVKMKDASTQTISISREEKSLGIMSQKFLMLFLTSQDGLVSINFAARVLLGDTKNDTTELGRFKTKIRRLYDIASVLSSIGLIKKYHYSDVNISKPAYKYIGPDVDIIRNAEYVLDFQNSGNPLSNSKHSLFDHFKRNLNLECNIPKFDINTGILSSKSTKSDSSSSSNTLLPNSSQISINKAYEKLPLKCQFNYNINQIEYQKYSEENEEISSNNRSDLFFQEQCTSQYHQYNNVEYNQLNQLQNYEYAQNYNANVSECENNTNQCQYNYNDQYDFNRQENYLFDDANARQRTIQEQKTNNLYFEKKNYPNHESRIIQSSFLESYYQEEFQSVESIEQSSTQNSCQNINVLPSFNTLLN